MNTDLLLANLSTTTEQSIANEREFLPVRQVSQPRKVTGIGARLAHARRVYGITKMRDYSVASLAEDLNMHHATIGRIESGERPKPDDATLLPIARHLGVTIAWLRYGGPVGGPTIPNIQFPLEDGSATTPRFYYGEPVDLPAAKRRKGGGSK